MAGLCARSACPANRGADARAGDCGDNPGPDRDEDDVSQAVRAQYEENPYPRWIEAGPPVQPIILKDTPPEKVPDVLVAGCGTGLSTIEFARQMRHARILAIDLSLASLSYAKRMAEKFSIGNIEFAQADIMMVGSIGRQFDFVDASGVLHYLADPWAGWRILLSLLRPGGVMQVGLYSESARQNVVAARQLIADRGYRPDLRHPQLPRRHHRQRRPGAQISGAVEGLFHDRRMP